MNGPQTFETPQGPVIEVARHPIEFTGTGSEYFRIWIVNLLLILVTLGLYYPWAKTRKLKYLYSNTQIAGYALDFHGSPKQMLRGFLLMVGFFFVYSMAGQASELAGAVAGLALAALWPALIRASLQFRLANTSWRGLRFQFTGTLPGIYKVFGKPMLGMVILGAVAAALMATKNTFGIILGVITLFGIYALMPYAYYCLKRYQHEHYAYAQLQTEFRATFGEVFKVFLKTAGVGLGMLVIGVVLASLLASATLFGAVGSGAGGSSSTAIMRALPILIVLGLLLQFVPLPYFQSRMQNLLWTQTGSRLVRFKSELQFLPLFKQTVLNWVLIIVTLGLYWPFAQIALMRLKLQAISVHMRVNPDTLVSQARPAGSTGVGDAAVDLAGIDLGL